MKSGINTVGGMIDSLKRFPKDFKVITHMKGAVHDGRVLAVKIDSYEKKKDRNIIKIETS